MFRYSIFVVAIALLVPISVAEGAVPDETCHVSESDTVSTRSLLQTNGGASYRLDLQRQAHEDVDVSINLSDQTPADSDASMRNASAMMLGNTVPPSKFLQSMSATGYAGRGDDGVIFSQAPTVAETVTLDEPGYQEVAALCCAEDMMIFIRRVITAKNYRVCEEGGLSGLAWWYDCRNDQTDYANLVTAIENATTGNCAWVGVAGQDCPEFSDDCFIDNPEPHPACVSATTTASTLFSTQVVIEASTTTPRPLLSTQIMIQGSTTTLSTSYCCRRKTILLSTNVAKVSPAASKITPFDCQKYPGAIQVIKNSQQGGYDVKQLDVATGIYQTLYHIPFTRTNPEFDTLNGVAVNPIDGIAYGLLHFGDNKNAYLVRFDEVAMEFVAKVGIFSPAGTFSSKGTFYYEAGGLISIPNAAQLKGFPNEMGNVAQLQDNEPITGKFQKFSVLDLAAYVGDLEGGEREDEYLLSLDKIGRLLVVKNTGAGSKYWIMDTTISGESKGFGAGWSFKQSVYFSSNQGTGVYQIPVTSLNVNDGSVMIKKVGESEKTSANDGMNCMLLGPPFPPPEEGCGEGFEEVPPEADGTCPSGTFRA